ncbi:MAG: DUF5916 domain-containing protein [bacterium]
MLIFLLMMVTGLTRSVGVNQTEVAPLIDGHIESIWQSADSASGFIQCFPYEGRQPSESTTVFVLQDADNLYFAFRCWARRVKPLNQMTDDDDALTVFLDPFGSKTKAYYFTVYVSGSYNDGMVLDDGRSTDPSWDGIWFYGVKLYEDFYDVEIKIPFNSIRYKKGLSEWGVNFNRFIAACQESDYWTEVLLKEGCLVSKYGTLVGVNPQSQGYYFELYPEGYLRSDRYRDGDEISKVSGSLNLKWDITPQLTFNATTLPDFAQIESDPFTLNLSRYETYLSERRPFFLEGREIFRMAGFGSGTGFYRPLDIFYSRRIGKSIDGEFVPILAGLKLTNRAERMEYGFLGALTDELSKGGDIIEPKRFFWGLRARRRLFTNSDFGALLSGTRGVGMKDDTYNYAIGLDGAYRSGANQLVVQGALSNRNGRTGYAFSSGFKGFFKNLLVLYSAEAIQDSFDVRDIGYVPWSGRSKILFVGGPYEEYAEGMLSSYWSGFGIMLEKEPGADWSESMILSTTGQFRNNWGINLEIYMGPYSEADTSYFKHGGHISVSGSGPKRSFWFGGSIFYDYNYSRDFLAYSGSTWQGFYWTPIPRISFMINSTIWIECDTTNSVIAMWPMATPRILVAISPKMNFSIFNEFVFSTPGSELRRTEIASNRFGFIFSYNFKPKSWLYIALNDHRARDPEIGHLVLSDRVTAIKAKYLVWF